MKLKKLLIIIAVLSVMAGFLAVPKRTLADNVVEGFYVKGALQTGDIVSQLAKPAGTVTITPPLESKEMFGVVVNGKSAPITLDRAGEQVFVASGGTYPVFVDNENGPIKSGDYIAMSSLAGIGTKATGEQPVVLGQATSSFDGTTALSQTQAGHKVGRININIAIGPNPTYKNTLAIPEPLQKIGNSVAGAEVTPFRIYISFVVFIVTASLTAILLMVGIRSSLISLGRNPLSRPTILRGLFQVIGLSLAIFIGSLVAVYLILRL